MRASFAPACPVCWASTGVAACSIIPDAVKIENIFPGSRIYIFLLKSEARLHRHPPHAACSRNLAKGKRVHRCIDGREVDDIENIVSRDSKVERARFLDLYCFVQRHIHRHLTRPLDNFSSGIAKAGPARVCACGARRAKRRRIEPFERGGIADRNRLSRNHVCAKRSAHAAADVQPSAKHARREVQSGANREVATPLPSSQNVAPYTLGNESPVFSEWQVVDPVSRESVPLVEAGKPAVRRNIKGILRHDASTTSDR